LWPKEGPVMRRKRYRFGCHSAPVILRSETVKKANNRISKGGFTIVEILIVVVIIAIAAMVALPVFSSAAKVQVRAAANMIAADIEYAKSLAISTGQNYSVVFDSTNDSYRVTDQAGNTIAHPVKIGFNYEVNFSSDSRLDEVDIVNADFDGASEIKFDYLGSPYDGSGSALTSGMVTLQAAGTTMRISVEPVTGYISITNL